MSERLVNCVKLGQELPGLEKPPFDDELGQQIFDKISQKAWLEWKDEMMIKIINEYRLNLADAAHYQQLIEQMKAFLNLESATEALEVENPERGQ